MNNPSSLLSRHLTLAKDFDLGFLVSCKYLIQTLPAGFTLQWPANKAADKKNKQNYGHARKAWHGNRCFINHHTSGQSEINLQFNA